MELGVDLLMCHWSGGSYMDKAGRWVYSCGKVSPVGRVNMTSGYRDVTCYGCLTAKRRHDKAIKANRAAGTLADYLEEWDKARRWTT